MPLDGYLRLKAHAARVNLPNQRFFFRPLMHTFLGSLGLLVWCEAPDDFWGFLYTLRCRIASDKMIATDTETLRESTIPFMGMITF